MRFAIIVGLVALLSAANLANAQAKELSLDDAIAKLRSTDMGERNAGDDALDSITKRGLTLSEGLQVISVATAKPAATSPSKIEASLSARLLQMLTSDPKPQYLPPIADSYDKLPADAKPVALAVFIALGPGDGLKAFAGKLNDQTQTDNNCDKALAKLDPGNQAVQTVLLEMLAHDGSTGSAVMTLLKFAESGSLPPDFLGDNLDKVDHSYQRWLASLAQIAKRLHGDTDPDYRWDDDYRSAQAVTEYFPDLLGHAGPKAEDILRKTCELKDPRLCLFALRSLLSLHKALPQNAVNLVAGDDEVRAQLYAAFVRNGVQSEFPKEFANQEALARSEMVNWLIYPTELNRAPNDIELMKVISQDTGGIDGIVDIYLFRFRTTGKHWAAKDGWMVGIAGGYRRADEPTDHAIGNTFSTFEKWDAKTPEQHVKDIQDLINEAWKKQDATKPKQP